MFLNVANKSFKFGHRYTLTPLSSRYTNTVHLLGLGKNFAGYAGNAGAVVGTYVDYQQMRAGTITETRFKVNTSVNLISIGVAAFYSNGLGLAIGAGYAVGSVLYDGSLWYINELSIGVAHINRAISNGWSW